MSTSQPATRYTNVNAIIPLLSRIHNIGRELLVLCITDLVVKIHVRAVHITANIMGVRNVSAHRSHVLTPSSTLCFCLSACALVS